MKKWSNILIFFWQLKTLIISIHPSIKQLFFTFSPFLIFIISKYAWRFSLNIFYACHIEDLQSLALFTKKAIFSLYLHSLSKVHYLSIIYIFLHLPSPQSSCQTVSFIVFWKELYEGRINIRFLPPTFSF